MLQDGLMMDLPLLLSGVIEHAAQQFGDAQIVSRETHGPLIRTTYADCARRSRKLANALASLGLQPGDAVGTIAWNNHRHMEVYFGVSGSGLVLHTCNPRLHPQQLIYVINHAEDKVVMFDATFAPLIKAIAAHCPAVQHWVCLADSVNTPAVEGVHVQAYESLIEPADAHFDWPTFDERTGAALCYTSGTTGHPKGVMYSHRAIVLNAMSGCNPGVLALAPSETILPVVPMFHVNAWCIPYAAAMAGAKLVLPGPGLDGKSLYELMESEQVTVSAGVPTIWQLLLAYTEQNELKFSTMRRTLVGGSAMPQSLIARFMDVYQVEVRHGWGMTETTAAATMGQLMPDMRDWTAQQKYALLAKQGKTAFGIEIKVVDELGATLPRDGSSQGELMVRGQWVLSAYFKSESSALVDGWFPTGDIATIDAQGVMQIRDRTKDVIKTGGEWISSIDLESAALAHPAVAMSAVIGVKHPKWDERPLMLVVRKPGQLLEKEALLAFLGTQVAKWWVPDDVIFLESLPVGGTGKVQKAELRQQYGGVFS
jgi:acyl-CoA synthetase (AMP-forming)/AMP-acid ligase II